MTINYTLGLDDYIAFNLYHTQNSPLMRRAVLFQRVLPPIAFIIFGTILANIMDLPLMFSVFIYTGLSVIWMLYFPKYFRKSLIKRVTKLLLEKNNMGLFGDYSLTVNEGGITSSGPNQMNEVKWSGIKSLEIAKEHIYLYNSSVSAYILPKVAFTDEAEQQGFVDMIAEKIR
ncbi:MULTISPECIES: YcxB family protein [unclassified Fusibacter]|uniref:YcxB family protein n=1 Tax=unclassified Fusibacter TaxID=2624464 RepID=UPI0010103617|nr:MULTISPECIES: YcxB family protein [unclassified Fusibacter]MCK8059157.1 YcxB family protein [Fusibacter sp. A2]NPE22566.1 YcxB family protein [Fusibacter sp. A1]RXV60669.1 YcxB family protein [Fusibacter sp. A1]